MAAKFSLEGARMAHGNNLIIISSRPFALRARRFPDAEEMEIAPFNRDQIALFLNHYYGEDDIAERDLSGAKPRRRWAIMSTRRV